MYLRRDLHAYAAMRTFVVIEVNERGYPALSVSKADETLLSIDDFRLQRAVDAFGNGIVGRIIIFRHTDSYMVIHKQVYILITTILYSSIRMVDQSIQCALSRRFYSHFQSLDRMCCMKRFGQTPAHNLAGLGIRNQMQITTSVQRVNVCYITNP